MQPDIDGGLLPVNVDTCTYSAPDAHGRGRPGPDAQAVRPTAWS